MTQKYYIGLSVTYHDPALAIVNSDGDVLFAEASERYLQSKRALNCEPDNLNRIADLLQTYCDGATEFDIAFNWSDKRPFYEKFCSFADYFSPRGLNRPRFNTLSTFLEKYKIFHMLACQTNSMARGGINLVRKLNELFPNKPISFSYFNHHLTHAAVGCYGSPFQEAACLVIDSYGEKGSTAFYHYANGEITLLKEIKGIESLGFYYMKLTELCGFDWMKGEEWKVMGLASYGKLDEEIYKILQSTLVVEDLGLKQDLDNIKIGLKEIEARLQDQANFKIANLAYTGQAFFTDLMEILLNNFYKEQPSENLVMAGGCALNSSFNGLILHKTKFEQLYVPSAPADDGTAIGAALLAYFRDHPQTSPKPNVISPYLGSTLSVDTLERFADLGQVSYTRHSPKDICKKTAQLLSDGKLVAWVQGRAEFGPRALGNRSILANPRDPAMKDKINKLVKFREEFRPFAPSIMHEFGDEYFEDYQESAYMERTLRFKESVWKKVPAVVHVDHTGRLQSVKKEWNPAFYDLIYEFYTITGIPLLLNTSFNVMGKPIIHTVEDAISVFYTTGLDALVINDYLFFKAG